MVVLAVTWMAKVGREGEVSALFAKLTEESRKEPGCVAYYLNHDLDEPTVFVVYERFKSVAALEDHAKSRHVEELLKKIGPMLDGDPKAKVYAPAAE